MKIYVEGGGERAALKGQLRKGFRALLVSAGFKNRLPRVVASGSRGRAYQNFKNSLATADQYSVLLVDSEDPLDSLGLRRDAGSSWDVLHARDGWSRPAAAEDRQAQLMVTCMETWLVADAGALADYFPGLVSNRIPKDNLESRTRTDIYLALQRATAPSAKGQYHKGTHSFELIGLVDASELKAKLPHFCKFVDALDEIL